MEERQGPDRQQGPGQGESTPPWRADGGPPWHADGGPPWQRGVRHRGSRGHHLITRLFKGQGDTGPLRRDPNDRLAGGVAAGLANRSGFDVTAVRIAFVVLTLVSSGFAVAVYVLAWLFVPAADTDASIAATAKNDRRGITLAAGLATLAGALVLIAPAFGDGWLAEWAWPQVFSIAGFVLIWRNATGAEQATMRGYAEPLRDWGGLSPAGAGPGGRQQRISTMVRLSIAGVMLAAGVIWLLSGNANIALLRPLGGMLLVIIGIVLIFGPWWLRIARDLVMERQARARAEEREEMAARVHDSVLQTLALIQRRASEPQQVIQLARAQERELRSWLFEGRAPGELGEEGMTFAAGVRQIQQEVEAKHGVSVETVTVGDCEYDDDLGALLAAGREATVNAAKWSGVPVISLFAEVQPEEISLVIRDRGRGFDPDSVPADRKGVAESIRGRMARRGGSATIRSAPGEGTKVSLTMPRSSARPQPTRI